MNEEEKQKQAEKYFFQGIVYSAEGEYDKAIEAYNKSIKLKPNVNAYFDLGIAYNVKGEYDKAIEAYNKAIKLNPNFATEYNNLGDVYKNKGEYDKAIEAYNKAFELKPDDDYFNYKIDMNDDNRNVYKEIYQYSYIIMRLLHINNNKEMAYGFAHYTRKSIAENLLIKKKKNDKGEGEVSPFRLSTILTSNDPTEGLVAFKYLGLENKETKMDYQAFIACFTFDAECLNQFRLYGKEQGQEATGVSLVFKKDFFSEQLTANMIPEYAKSASDGQSASRKKKPSQEEKYPLYRCVYIDPETRQIIALGHKDDYVFFRDEPETDSKKIQEKINDYKEKINKNLQAVREEFDNLKSLIETNKDKINLQLVCDLLIHMRYLAKHIAFKEEQECRIVKVEALSNHEKVKLEDNKMFINTCSIVDFVDRIYFAPSAVDMEFFQEKLVYDGLKHITCYQCKHPIRTHKA
ncbi:MAG: tetratricopeptide repeat protein [Prevotellaceae bacterium]|jgi:tetratricopeptide (TPR) repeat protein|nr:tetratricopeptide repeat protein [Prevotellaceae bacterium]